MADATQNFANHTRWHPPFHFFVLPVLLINVIWSVLTFVKTLDVNSGWWVVVSLALAMLGLFVRTYSIKVQDRIIRLEERVRYQQLLSPAMAEQANVLPITQIVAMRFAPDDELPQLVGEVLAGRLKTRKDIKQSIKNWRADTFRI